MQYFTADARDGATSFKGCTTCCCQPASGMPGEVNKWSINYAPWSVPLGGRGLTGKHVFDISPRVDPTAPAEAPLFVTGTMDIDDDTEISGDLFPPGAEYPAGAVFAVLPGYEPANGSLSINASTGEYVYTPASSFRGRDGFFYSVTVPGSAPLIGEASLAVQFGGLPVVNSAPSPAIVIPDGQVITNAQYHTVTFPIEFSPAAVPGDVYRLTVRQQAMDCDSFYWHAMCIDITVGKCG